MKPAPDEVEVLTAGGLPIDRAFFALQKREPATRACYVYDLDLIEARARRFRKSFEPVRAMCAFALKANALPAILERLRACGFGADAGSLGELEVARASGFDAAARLLNGNGRSPEEADWVARFGVHSVNADHVEELDLLERAAAREGSRVRVALRVNPRLATAGHPYLQTGDPDAKFGIAAQQALEVWAARGQWPHLQLDGLHLHLGSQVMEPRLLAEAVEVASSLVLAASDRGAPLRLVNLGGGFGVDYSGEGVDFPLEHFGAELASRTGGQALEWVFEPGRWISAAAGVLVSEVLWVKRRDDRRFVVLAAGMNDLIWPALYGARHRIVPVRPRSGPVEAATVVGPVCESGDVFSRDVPLPPLETGDLVAILDAGAYSASMASNYNGRGRLAELVIDRGRVIHARAAETPTDLLARNRFDVLDA